MGLKGNVAATEDSDGGTERGGGYVPDRDVAVGQPQRPDHGFDPHGAAGPAQTHEFRLQGGSFLSHGTSFLRQPGAENAQRTMSLMSIPCLLMVVS